MFDFSKKSRLVSKYDFQSVFTKSNKATHRCLIALYKPNQLPHARLGIITPKKHAKLAVMRNQIKRLVRESFRHHQAALKGLDIIVLMRSECSPLDKCMFRKHVDSLWQNVMAS